MELSARLNSNQTIDAIDTNNFVVIYFLMFY